MKKPTVSKICAVIMIVLLLVCVIRVAYNHNQELQREKELQAMQLEKEAEPETVPVEEPEPEPTVTEEPEPEPEPVYCDAVIDFAALKEENEDIYAWINVPGTVIDYPVLQSEEDNYYLERNLDHSTGYPGCIYTNKCNAKDFSDSITVLYGHNMKKGTMFAGLHDFEEEDFFEQNDQILVYTEDARYTYRIYMAAAYNDNYIPAVYDVTSGEAAIQFVESIKDYEDKRKFIREDMEVTEEDSLIVLSTCIANEGTKRYLVVGQLVEIAEYYERFYTDL